MPKAALHNLGCKVNAYETEAMEQLLRSAGYEIVPFDSMADVYVINTCSVTNIADRKSRQMLHRAKKLNPQAVVVAAGCYVQVAAEQLKADPAVDILIGNNQKGQLAEILEEFGREGHGDSHVLDIGHISHYEELKVERPGERTRAFIKVQDGCNQFCSYCIIPYARGRVRSREIGDVLGEVQALARSGYQEVVLTGIHLSSYGLDFEKDAQLQEDYQLAAAGKNVRWLLKLIEQVSTVENIHRIRLGSLEPRIVTEEFAYALAANPKICPHFHLSLQSGSDSVLKRMNRHYTVEHYLDLIEYARARVPGITFSSDIIVGFPGETEEDFQGTLDLIRRVGYMQLFTFIYSRREGTPAAGYPDPTPRSEKTGRMARLLKTQDEIAMALVKAQVGQTVRVLVEGFGRAEGTLTGRLDNNLTVEFAGEPALLGQYASVRLTGARATVLLGEWTPPVPDKIG